MRAALALLAALAHAAAAQPGWTEHTFAGRERTAYRVDGGTIEAQCKASASGLIRRETVDLGKTPVLRWRWKVEAVYPGLNEKDKSGDDFPARVYVVVDGGWQFWRTRSLVYVWSSASPQGSDWPSAYAWQAHVVALRSGSPGEWREERRDVRADFRRYFGRDVPAVDGVAIMTDCDDAGGATRAWYEALRFER